jgi:HEAT repeat protein
MKTKLFLRDGTQAFAVALAVILALFTLVSCEVTSEKIQTWKKTIKGAAKIRAALRDQDQTLPIRVEAAEALCEMGLFVQLAEDVKALTPGDRKTVMETLSKRLVGKMEGSNPGATTRIQIQAKDALYSLREMAEGPERKTVEEKVVRWLLADWQKRSSGEHSSDKVITGIGAAAGPVLAGTIGQGTPVVVSATMLRKVGSQQDRDAAAQKLVELAAKQKPPQVTTFHALGKVGSLTAVKYLEQVAHKGEFQKRVWALRALALFPHVSVIDTVKAIAGDASLKDDQALLRDEAFTVLEKIDDEHALLALTGFLNDKEETVRYRASEAILGGFGAKGLTKLLEGLPSRYTYQKEELVDFIEKDIQQLGTNALPPLRRALSSKSWVARLIAARMLGRIGSKQDVTALEKLGSDSTKLKGWEGGATVGSEAMEAAKLLKSR